MMTVRYLKAYCKHQGICVDEIHVSFGYGDDSDRSPILEYKCMFAFGNWSFNSNFEMLFSMGQWEISIDATEKASRETIMLIDDFHQLLNVDILIGRNSHQKKTFFGAAQELNQTECGLAMGLNQRECGLAMVLNET